MNLLLNRGNLKDMLLIVLGTLLLASGINLIYDPMSMVTGGVTGIAIVVKHLTEGVIEGGLPLWLTNLICNIPLFLLAFWMLGPRFVTKTLFATISLTVFLYIIPVPGTAIFSDDILLAAVFGGIIAGVGIGFVFATMATTGGTDMLGMLVHKKKPYYSVPQLMFAIDGFVVLAGAVAFGINKALYSIIAVYICSKVSDGLLEGMKFAKSAYIISDKHAEIAQEILYDLNRGVTGLHARGMYSNMEKNVLFCVASKKEMIGVIDIVHKNDPQAFVIVSDVREVMGEGFIEYKRQ